MTLTFFFVHCDETRFYLRRIVPHHLANNAVYPIATNHHIPTFVSAVFEEHIYSVDTFCDFGNFFPEKYS